MQPRLAPRPWPPTSVTLACEGPALGTPEENGVQPGRRRVRAGELGRGPVTAVPQVGAGVGACFPRAGSVISAPHNDVSRSGHTGHSFQTDPRRASGVFSPSCTLSVTILGTSAKWLSELEKKNLKPGEGAARWPAAGAPAASCPLAWLAP